MAFEGAILDFDGTLVDSIDAWHDLEGVLAREAQATVTLEDRKQLIPMSLDEIAQWFHGRFGLGKDGRAVRNLMDEYMVDALSHSKALPGVEAFLESCKRADVKLNRQVLSCICKQPLKHSVYSRISRRCFRSRTWAPQNASQAFSKKHAGSWQNQKKLLGALTIRFTRFRYFITQGIPPSGSSIRTKVTPLKSGNKKPISSCEDSTSYRSQRWKHIQSRTSRRTRL